MLKQIIFNIFVLLSINFVICSATKEKSENPEISCTFYNFASRFYICDLHVENENYFDNFSSIEGEHFPSKTDLDVTQVHLSGNSKIFPQIICESFTSLKRIFASNLKVEKISQNSLESCSNLLQLDFQSSEISEISKNSFDGNLKLEILNLKSNQLSALDDEIFKTLTALRELNLDGNPLKTFTAKIPPQLEKISLRGCSLEGSWKNSENFKFVDIGGNFLTEIEKSSFASSEIFAFLADDNKIETLDSMSFGENLKFLIMNGNKLKAIDFYFENFVNLKFEVKGNECEDEKFDGQNWATLGSCFENFEKKAQNFSLNFDSLPLFSSIRKEILIFSIKAPSDVILTLVDSLTHSSAILKVSFGAEENSKTEANINGIFLGSSSIHGLLDPNIAKNFTVQWSVHGFEIRQGFAAVMHTNFMSLMNFNFFGFSTESDWAEISVYP